MNLWMKGTEGREVFSIKSPPCKSFRGNHGLPYNVDKEPYLTLAARQHGEAWEHPFISVYEPFTSEEGKSIESIKGFDDENGNKDFAGIQVKHKSGREDFIFSAHGNKVAKYKGMTSDAALALIGNEMNGDFVLFMGNGTQLKANGLFFATTVKGNVVLEKKKKEIYLHNEVPVIISINNKNIKFEVGEFRKIEF
jgi:hypothetical protein